MKIFTRYFHFKEINFDNFKLLKFVTFYTLTFACKRSFCEFLRNFGGISPEVHHKTCKISKNPHFELNYKRRQSKGEAFAFPLTEQRPKHFEDFIVRIRAKN